MNKKILIVANTDMHISLCYLPYMKYFKDLGYTVHVATNSEITFEYCDKKIKIPISRRPFKFGNIKAIRMLRKVIAKEKYDLISASTPMGGVVARLAAKRARINNGTKLIYTAHGFHFYKGCSLINKVIYYPVEKVLMKLVDVLVTINEEDYNFALKHFKVRTEYIKGIGFQSKKFENKITEKEKRVLRKNLGIKKEDYVITYVAEISKRKRQTYLLKCLAKMNLTNIKVLLVGDNILKNNIYKLIKKYNLEENVKILGFRSDVEDIFDITDLVISVSMQEGLPLNIMEAMKKQKPIIVTDCRGNRDLINNGVNGIIVPINNPDLLIKNINDLKNNKDFAKKLGKKNKYLADEYSIDKILPKYVKIYNCLLNGDDYE